MDDSARLAIESIFNHESNLDTYVPQGAVAQSAPTGCASVAFQQAFNYFPLSLYQIISCYRGGGGARRAGYAWGMGGRGALRPPVRALSCEDEIKMLEFFSMYRQLLSKFIL